MCLLELSHSWGLHGIRLQMALLFPGRGALTADPSCLLFVKNHKEHQPLNCYVGLSAMQEDMWQRNSWNHKANKSCADNYKQVIWGHPITSYEDAKVNVRYGDWKSLFTLQSDWVICVTQGLPGLEYGIRFYSEGNGQSVKWTEYVHIITEYQGTYHSYQIDCGFSQRLHFENKQWAN